MNRIEGDGVPGFAGERLPVPEGFSTYYFPPAADGTHPAVWMVSEIPGATAMFLAEVSPMQAAGYPVLLSLSDNESRNMIQSKFASVRPVMTADGLPLPRMLIVSGGETEDGSVRVIDGFMRIPGAETVVFQEDAPGTMRRLIRYMTQPGNGRYLPDLILTPTVWKKTEYERQFAAYPKVRVSAVGNPALDLLPSEQPPDAGDVSKLRRQLDIPDSALVFYLVGKPAQDMEIGRDIALPAHQDLTGILAGRRDINSFFLQFSMRAIEKFRTDFSRAIGQREIVVLHRPHPRDRENTQGQQHPFARWFAETYPKSPVRTINMTTAQWNAVTDRDMLLYAADTAVFFDSTLIDRTVIDIAAQYAKYGRPYEKQTPHIAYPVVFQPWAALCVPWLHQRIEEERVFAASFTRYWQELGTSLLPRSVFRREQTEAQMLPFMLQLAREYVKLDAADVWREGTSSGLVLSAIGQIGMP